MTRASILAIVAALALAACGGKHEEQGANTSSNTGSDSSSNTGGNDTGTAQNALGGVGVGPALNGTGGVQNPGNASGDNPQGEVSPSGPGVGNSAAY